MTKRHHHHWTDQELLQLLARYQADGQSRKVFSKKVGYCPKRLDQLLTSARKVQRGQGA